MKTATIEDLKRDASQLDAVFVADESTRVTANGRLVGVIVPIPESRSSVSVQWQWPDFAAQQRAVFGDRVLPAGTLQALLDDDRGDR